MGGPTRQRWYARFLGKFGPWAVITKALHHIGIMALTSLEDQQMAPSLRTYHSPWTVPDVTCPGTALSCCGFSGMHSIKSGSLSSLLRVDAMGFAHQEYAVICFVRPGCAVERARCLQLCHSRVL